QAVGAVLLGRADLAKGLRQVVVRELDLVGEEGLRVLQVVRDHAGREVRREEAVVQHVELDHRRESALASLQDDIQAMAVEDEVFLVRVHPEGDLLTGLVLHVVEAAAQPRELVRPAFRQDREEVGLGLRQDRLSSHAANSGPTSASTRALISAGISLPIRVRNAPGFLAAWVFRYSTPPASSKAWRTISLMAPVNLFGTPLPRPLPRFPAGLAADSPALRVTPQSFRSPRRGSRSGPSRTHPPQSR